MTKDQIIICEALGNLRYLPGSFDKRLAHNLASTAKLNPGKELTESQDEWMYRLLYKYRKQLPKVYGIYQNNEFCRIKPPKYQS